MKFKSIIARELLENALAKEATMGMELSGVQGITWERLGKEGIGRWWRNMYWTTNRRRICENVLNPSSLH